METTKGRRCIGNSCVSMAAAKRSDLHGKRRYYNEARQALTKAATPRGPIGPKLLRPSVARRCGLALVSS